jgi:threonylcarbamoyladenosine tRNA methylthiotransferase MtaB
MQIDLGTPKKKVSVHTLGCRLNISESGSIVNGFTKRGYEVVEFGEPADVTFINTCTVTDKADSTCRNLIRKAHKSSPEGKIVVAGCYAQMEPKAIASMQGVDLVLGSSEKYKVFEYLDEEDGNQVHVDKENHFYGAVSSPEDGHTRGFLKIQDGCNYVCSFCIIPFARGRSRAISIADAMDSANTMVGQGYQEIVLTGVNVGEYNQASGERLSDLVRELLTIDGLKRLRLGSVEPNTFSDDLLNVLSSSKKVMNHFHVPLQSGDDELLTSMRRKYNRSQYQDVIHSLLDIFPGAGFGADIIVGYPGETDQHFQNTYDLLHELPITHFHVFPYSKRKNTTAAKMDNHIHHAVKKSRVQSLIMFGDAKLDLFANDQIGKKHQVLFERRDKEGFFTGYTTNYVKVRVKSDANLKNCIREVLVTDAKEGACYAELILNRS